MGKTKKIKSEEQGYKDNPYFWTKKGDNLTVIGDYLGRLPSITLIDVKVGEIILDAGCGAGFIARRLAKQGAKVYGCDRNNDMINQAKLEEKQNTWGILYNKSDIVSMPYKNNFFDKIACIAVLIHNSPNEINKFLREGYRVLKNGGIIVVSLMHPFLFQQNSPCRTNKTSWVKYTPLDNLPMNQSQRFKEDYYNFKGQLFSSTVWYHPENKLIEMFQKARLTVISSQSQFITKEVLDKTNQTGAVGYPAFLQIVAKKI